MKRAWTMLAAVVVSGLAARGAAGVVVYDNLGTAPYSADGYASFGLIDGNVTERAMQFTAPQTVALSSLAVAIGQAYWDGTTYGGTARIDLVASAGGAIGSTVLESWTSSSQTSYAGGLETLTSVARPTLTKGTKYWLVMSDAAGSYLGGAWYLADSSTDRRIVNVAWQSGAGQAWSYYQIYAGFRTQVMGSYLPGDLNGDGVVTADDYALIDRGYAKHLTDAADGDFNGDGVIDAADYLIIDTAFAEQNGGLSPGMVAGREEEFGAGYVSELVAAVPEPGVVGFAGAMAIGLVGRRRKK